MHSRGRRRDVDPSAVIDVLENAGFEVIEASSADAALDIINKQTIHLLFTDI